MSELQQLTNLRQNIEIRRFKYKSLEHEHILKVTNSRPLLNREIQKDLVQAMDENRQVDQWIERNYL